MRECDTAELFVKELFVWAVVSVLLCESHVALMKEREGMGSAQGDQVLYISLSNDVYLFICDMYISLKDKNLSIR